MSPIFKFPKEARPFSNPAKRRNIFSLWFHRVFFFISLISLIALVTGNILWKTNTWKIAKRPGGESLPELSKKNSSGNRTQAVHLPPLLVSLKGDQGIRMARIHVNLQVSPAAVKKEILSNKKATRKHLLILLSGRQSQDMKNKKTYFEHQLLSWMNAFLSNGSVNKVTIQTTLLN